MEPSELLGYVVRVLEQLAVPYLVTGSTASTQYIVEWAGRLGVLDIWQAVAKRTDQTP